MRGIIIAPNSSSVRKWTTQWRLNCEFNQRQEHGISMDVWPLYESTVISITIIIIIIIIIIVVNTFVTQNGSSLAAYATIQEEQQQDFVATRCTFAQICSWKSALCGDNIAFAAAKSGDSSVQINTICLIPL